MRVIIHICLYKMLNLIKEGLIPNCLEKFVFIDLSFKLQEGVQQLVLGLYIIRGDNMYVSFQPPC